MQALPYNEQAEVAILSAIMVDDTVVPRAMTDIKEEHFYKTAHKVIFRAMVQLYEKGMGIDGITLISHLKTKAVLDKAGGKDYISEIYDYVVSGSHYEYHLKVLLDQYKRRKSIEISKWMISEVYSGEKDPDEIILRAHDLMYGISTHGAEGYRPLDEYLVDALEAIETATKSLRGMRGIPTGFHDLDKILGGLLPGKLYVIGARPSTGKTAIALNIIDNVIRNTEGNVLMSSLEQDGTSLALRLLSSNSGVELERLVHGIGMKGERISRVIKAADALYGKSFYIDDYSLKKASQIRNSVKAFQAQNGPVKLIVVDFMQLLQDEQDAKSHEYSLASACYIFKALAKELKATCIILSQVKRIVDDRDNPEPRVSDLSESSGMDNAADAILFLWKQKQRKGDVEEIPDNLVIVSVAKHRDGPRGSAELLFSGKYTRFDNYLRENPGYLDELAKQDPRAGKEEEPPES